MNKIEENITRRKFQDKITIGTLKRTGWKIADLQKLQNIGDLEIKDLIVLLNAMIIEGEPFSDDEDIEVLREATAFLEKRRKLKAAKEKLKEKRSPNI